MSEDLRKMRTLVFDIATLLSEISSEFPEIMELAVPHIQKNFVASTRERAKQIASRGQKILEAAKKFQQA